MKALQGERKLGEAEESDEDAELGGTTQGYGYGDGYDIRWHKNTGKQAKDMDWVPKKAITSVDNQGKCKKLAALPQDVLTGAVQVSLVTHSLRAVRSRQQNSSTQGKWSS